ncbi:MAG: hypothetical protein B7X76_01520 [Azorhizobium sp. 39-67-5]|nr:MAG: hypothetical protein B7X76_01520 [Azorhizobium sp. 39-67-5]
MSRPLLPPALRFAVRELRGARRGFFVFLACLALGVMAIAGVGSFARALTDGLAREGRTILGGDAAFTLVQREAAPAEVEALRGEGDLSRVASLRAMARAAGGDATLVELKAVDPASYPLVGTLKTAPAAPLATLLAGRDGQPGALADETLMARLNVKVGDTLAVGDARFLLTGVIADEPDRLSAGVGFGPRLMVSLEGLSRTALVQPGSLVRWIYRVRLADTSDDALTRFVDKVHADLPEAGFEVRTRDGASPQLERNVRRIAQYLTLVGLTALLVGGVGVANAVSSHLAAKRESIATFKALGASRGTIFGTYLAQVGILAAIGIGIGLVLGAALPFAVAWAAGHLIPFPLAPEVTPLALALAALYGALVTLAFTLWPLAQAQEAPVSRLFRDSLGEERRRPPLVFAALCGLAVVALAALAIATAEDMRAASIFLGAAAGVFVLLRGVAMLLMALARRLPRPRNTMARLALANP